MIAEYLSEQAGVYGRLFFCERQEHKSAAYLTDGEFIFGQRNSLHLRPVVGDVFDILGVRAELAEELPFLLYLAQILLAFVSFTPLFDQPRLMEYPPDGLVTTRQIVLALKTLGTFEWELSSEMDNPSCQGRRGLVGTAEFSAARSDRPDAHGDIERAIF